MAMLGDHRRVALALAGDLEGLELVDASGHVEVAHQPRARGDRDRRLGQIQADVGGDQLMVACGHADEDILA